MWAFLVASWPGVLKVQGIDGRVEARGLGELVGGGEVTQEKDITRRGCPYMKYQYTTHDSHCELFDNSVANSAWMHFSLLPGQCL
jgi:hypothetical protein